MVNRVVVDYLKKYKDKYNLEDLKKKIIASGYDAVEVEEALIALDLKKPSEIGKPVALGNVATFKASEVPKESFFTRLFKKKSEPVQKVVKQLKKKVEKKVIVKKDLKNEGILKMPVTSFSRKLKIGASFGIFFVFLMILLFIFGGGIAGEVYLWSPLTLVLMFLILISFIAFFYGFFTLGERYDSRLMRTVSFLFVMFLLVLIILQLLLMIFPEVVGDFFFGHLRDSSTSQFPSIKEIYSNLTTDYLNLFIVLGVIVLILSALNIMLGVALYRLKENVQYAKITASLMIAGGALLSGGIGFLILIVALILEIILLFKASENM